MMQGKLIDGWVSGVKHSASPHYDVRSTGEVSLLVLHNISLPPRQFGTGKVEEFFLGKLNAAEHPYFSEIASLRVSAHFFIEREGRIVQFVSCLNRAWHAGKSSYAGREDCNDYSLGIELEGADDIAYSVEQYGALLQLTQLLLEDFPALTQDRICGHSDIAPMRKTDPGEAFDWSYFRAELAKRSST